MASIHETPERRGRPSQKVEWGTPEDYLPPVLPDETRRLLTEFGLDPSWQMIEEVYIANDNTRAVGVYRVIAERFKGHLIGSPMFQGVLNPEAAAQTWIVWSMKNGEMTPDQTGLFAGIDGFVFRRPLLPGTTANFGIVKTDTPNRLYTQVMVGGHVLTDGYIEAAIVSKEDAERRRQQAQRQQDRSIPLFPFQE